MDLSYFKKVPKDYTWEFTVTPHYGIIALGKAAGDQISDIRADIERIENGSWVYHIYDTPYCGSEPSLYEAKKRVMKIIEGLEYENSSDLCQGVHRQTEG